MVYFFLYQWVIPSLKQLLVTYIKMTCCHICSDCHWVLTTVHETDNMWKNLVPLAPPSALNIPLGWPPPDRLVLDDVGMRLSSRIDRVSFPGHSLGWNLALAGCSPSDLDSAEWTVHSCSFKCAIWNCWSNEGRSVCPPNTESKGLSFFYGAAHTLWCVVGCVDGLKSFVSTAEFIQHLHQTE